MLLCELAVHGYFNVRALVSADSVTSQGWSSGSGMTLFKSNYIHICGTGGWPRASVRNRGLEKFHQLNPQHHPSHSAWQGRYINSSGALDRLLPAR